MQVVKNILCYMTDGLAIPDFWNLRLVNSVWNQECLKILRKRSFIKFTFPGNELRLEELLKSNRPEIIGHAEDLSYIPL